MWELIKLRVFKYYHVVHVYVEGMIYKYLPIHNYLHTHYVIGDLAMKNDSGIPTESQDNAVRDKQN